MSYGGCCGGTGDVLDVHGSLGTGNGQVLSQGKERVYQPQQENMMMGIEHVSLGGGKENLHQDEHAFLS